MTIERIDFRAVPVDDGEPTAENERRFRATIERAFLTVDNALRALSGSRAAIVSVMTGVSPALSPARGDIQTWELTANSTPTDAFSNGQRMTLEITSNGFSVTWPAGVLWTGGAAPTLSATEISVVVLWKSGGVLKGYSVGDLS